MVWKNPTPAELAQDWVASRRIDAAGEGGGSCGHLAQLLIGGDFADREPELTWETILLVMREYPEADLYAETKTEAQQVCGVLAAGPIEDLLSYHGEEFIDRFEDEARSDRRMAWALGGVIQATMTDEIWSRVQRAAENSYWLRKWPDVRTLLILAAEHLRHPMVTTESEFSAAGAESRLRSWCSWTTFDRLVRDAGYWTAELPLENELGESYVKDGGTWGQPFPYGAIAHVIIPRRFIEEPWPADAFRQWVHEQDIDRLAGYLDRAGVRYHLSKYALEVKLF